MAEKKIKEKIKADGALAIDALQSKLLDLKKEGMNHRFQHASGQMPKTHLMRKNRREIARVKTAIAAGKKVA